MSDTVFTYEQLHSTRGHRLTRSLFHEECLPTDEPIITLNTHPREGLYHLRPTFIAMTINDPTELLFAEAVFGDYQFWKNITNCNWMQKYLKEWREVAEVKRKQQAFEAIMAEVSDGRSKFSAAKYLLEEPWKDKKKSTKEQSKKTTEKAFDSVASDVARLKDYM